MTQSFLYNVCLLLNFLSLGLTDWVCTFSLKKPLNVNQTVVVKRDVNWAVLAIFSWLVWLGQPACIYCRYSHLLLLQATSLPAPCRCLSVDYTLSACLHVVLQYLLRLLAEQASSVGGHDSQIWGHIFSMQSRIFRKSISNIDIFYFLFNLVLNLKLKGERLLVVCQVLCFDMCNYVKHKIITVIDFFCFSKKYTLFWK